MSETSFDVIVVGTGITGLTAANDAAKRGLSTATLEGEMFGGLVLNINHLSDPPQADQPSGAGYASELMMMGSDAGVTSINEAATALERDGDALVVVTDAERYRARAVIVASGAKLKRLGVPGEMDFDYKGVSQCADCDGPMFRDADVVVVGGGDSALQEALVLAEFCRTVHLLNRGKGFRARAQYVDAIKAKSNVKTVWSSVVEEIAGDGAVEKVRIKNTETGATSEIPCKGFFAFVGLEPNTEFVPAEVARDANGALVTDAKMQTTMKGVFAAGAVRAGYGGLLAQAVEEARTAAQGVGKA